ncbi:MAG TPA: hypothetical protein VH479_09615 [Acidimicrobiales bacterium]|jgi:capsular polysaccharide biosynthesis protein
MDLLTALRILIRRWPVVLIGLAVTVIGFIQIGAMIAPTYEAKSTVLLLSPGSNTTNPFNEFGGNLDVTADALMVVLQSPAGAEKLKADGATGSFKLERTSGPLVDITASAGSKVEATKTVEVVVEGVKSELELRQQASPIEQRITVSELTLPVASAKLGSRIRAQFVVVAVGLTGTVAAALAVDAIMRQRSEARLRREAEEDEEYDVWEPPADPAHAPLTSRSFAPNGESRRSPTVNGTPAASPLTPVNGRGTGVPSSIYRPATPRPRPEVPADGSSNGGVPGADRRPTDPAPEQAGTDRAGEERGSAGTTTWRPARPTEVPRPVGDSRPSDPKVDEARRANFS